MNKEDCFVQTCPICESEYDGRLCGCCGFDPCQDYESFLTLMPLPADLRSVAGLRADYLASLRREDCPCCGRHVERDYCGFCGFHVAGLKGIRSQERVDALAAAHREAFLKDLTDIAIVNYHYRWNGETSRLELSRADERRIADGTQCHPGIFWTEPLFGQLDTNDYPTLELMLSYRWLGKRRTCKVTVPTLRTDTFWRVGLLIDDSLSLRVFLGGPTEFTVSEPEILMLD